MDEGLVGVHHLLEVDSLLSVVCKGSITIEVLVLFNDVLDRCFCLDDSSTEDAARKVTTIGDEVDVGIEITLNLCQRLTYLGDVLVLEGFVNAQVVVTP